jgi:hypothetical protein
MPRLAFYTWGISYGPHGSEARSGFEAMLLPVFLEAKGSEGFIDRAMKPEPKRPSFGQDFGPWGLFAVPRFYDGGTEPEGDTQASTLSLWRDIEAVRRFAYSGLHKVAVSRGGEWFRKEGQPNYVMWWVEDDVVPTWQEAARKLEELNDNGATPSAFNFKTRFDPRGQQIRLRPMPEFRAPDA